jgi:hypothetical protein
MHHLHVLSEQAEGSMELTNPPSSDCKHLTLELEASHTGYLTGNYRCVACGTAIPKQPIRSQPSTLSGGCHGQNPCDR